MNIKTLMMAAVVGTLVNVAMPAHAQTAARTRAPAADSAVATNATESLRNALKRIGASADTNSAMIEAVTAHDIDKVKAILAQNGASPASLKSTSIDVAGASKGPRKMDPNTIYFDVIPHLPTSPTPVGIIYIHGYGWVDWNDFMNSWSWW